MPRHAKHTLLTAMIMITAVMAFGISSVGQASVPQQGQVEGYIVQVFPTVIVIRDERGHATILQLSPRTQVNGPFKPGDKVVAYVTPYGVSSIQMKPNLALIP